MSSLVLALPTGGLLSSREVLNSVRIDEAASGKEARSSWWSAPRYRYHLVSEVLRADAGSRADAQAWWNHFARHFGQLDSFLFTDPDDNSVTAHKFGVGDGTTTNFQLQRSQIAAMPGSPAFWPAYSDGFEPVWDLNGAPLIYIGGVLKATPADYSVSATGLVTFTSAPAGAASLTWTGSYYRRVRLDGSVVYKRFGAGYFSAEASLISVKP